MESTNKRINDIVSNLELTDERAKQEAINYCTKIVFAYQCMHDLAIEMLLMAYYDGFVKGKLIPSTK